ncbi:hypothetical protein TI05_04495 [Achromatium sp. WMS3]|nr:hypothetical protein TI05_04495 [Achromatium sp. WMS3]
MSKDTSEINNTKPNTSSISNLPDHSQALRGNAIGNASRHKNLNCSILFRQSEECLIFSSTLLH